MVSSEDLRRYVGRGSAIGVRPLGYGLQLLRETKVNELDVASLRHRDYKVLRFEISVYDIVIVQIFDGEKYLSDIVRHVLLHLAIVLPYLAQKCAALDVFKLEVQILLILKRAEYAHQEWALWNKRITGITLMRRLLLKQLALVLKELEYFPLRDDVIDVLHLGHAFFP